MINYAPKSTTWMKIMDLEVRILTLLGCLK